jgi:hypothetical protein
VFPSTQPAAAAQLAAAPIPRARPAAPPPQKKEVVLAVGEDAIVEEDTVDEKAADVVSVGDEAVVDPDAGPPLPPPSFESLAEPVPEAMQSDIRGFLEKDEKMLWLGQPSRQMAAAGSWVAIPVGLLFVLVGSGVIVGGLALMQKKDVPAIAGLGVAGVGAVFALLGLVACLMPLFARQLRGVRECYLITNRRAIICKSVFGRSNFTCFNGSQLRGMKRISNENVRGAGSLIFQKNHLGYDENGQEINETIGFKYLHDVKKVEQFLKQTLVAGTK